MQSSRCDVSWVKVTSYFDLLYTTTWRYLQGKPRPVPFWRWQACEVQPNWALTFLPRGLCTLPAVPAGKAGKQVGKVHTYHYQHLAAARDTRTRVSRGTVPGLLFGEVRRRGRDLGN